jgi:hypothetical protein
MYSVTLVEQIVRDEQIAIVVFPISHVQGVYLGAALLQQYRGHSGVNTA